MEVARLAYQVLSDAAALALMPDDSRTRLKGQPVGRKRVAWCEPLPLDEVKARELDSWTVLSTIDTPTAAIAANTRDARKTFMT